MKIKNLPLLVVFPFFTFFLFACATADSSSSKFQLSDRSLDAIQSIEAEILRANQEIKEHSDHEGSDDEDLHAVSIPVEINQQVQKWVEYFSIKDRERFQRFLDRGEYYRETIQRILNENDVPQELYYLAMIESGFVTHAHSRASAVGVWQFIYGTGIRYGLRRDYYVDERRDVIRATKAASQYLKSLHTAFQSWYLAMAGYNAGENRILRAIMQGKSRNFWTLVERRKLPRETRNYVPKFLAAMIIGRNPEKFGFTINKPETMPELKLVSVPGSVRLADIAKLSGMSYAELKKHNPNIRRGMTPRNRKSYALWVPENHSSKFDDGLYAKLAAHKQKGRAIASSGSSKYHRVRRGENLTLIAKRYGMSVRQLKRLNGIRGSRIYPGKRLKVSGSGYVRFHRVRRGEALSTISRRYNVTISYLKRINRLRSNRIYAGQRLKIRNDI